jgi:hypothetical protein
MRDRTCPMCSSDSSTVNSTAGFDPSLPLTTSVASAKP